MKMSMKATKTVKSCNYSLSMFYKTLSCFLHDYWDFILSTPQYRRPPVESVHNFTVLMALVMKVNSL